MGLLKEFDCELYRQKKETIRLLREGRNRRRMIYTWWRKIKMDEHVNTYDNPLGFIGLDTFSIEDGLCRLCGADFKYDRRFHVTPTKKSKKIGDVYYEIVPSRVCDLCPKCTKRRKNAAQTHKIDSDVLLDIMVINTNIKKYEN